MLSSSLEIYVEIIYKLERKEKEIKALEIAQDLNVPLSRVVQAIQRLHYQKYLTYSPYQPVTLTERGQQMGKYLIARNELIREFLEILNIQENLESELEAMKQYLSDESLRTIEKFVLFMRQYPEVTNRYKLVSRKLKEEVLLPGLPE